ncbi:MAG TPA: ATP-binding protein, partial [Armatimonadota bacterium]
LVIVPQPTEVGDSIRWAVAQAKSSGDPTVRVDLPRGPLMAMAREEHLRRVLLNLLQNALRHTPPGGEVAVTGRTEGDRVVVQVRDTGEGIAPDHLPHVFERFYRADAGRARAQGGTGLGLAICQSLLTAVGGTLSLDSEVGVGTTVTVTLPAAELQLEDESPEGDGPVPDADAPTEAGAAARDGGELPLARN